MTRFFFFGCWNRDNCDSNEPDYRSHVLEYIKRNSSNFDFGIVAGDNVYPHTSKEQDVKKKVYKKSTIDTGFEKLAAIGKPVIVAVGNHDVVNEKITRYQESVIKKHLKYTINCLDDVSLCQSCMCANRHAKFLFIDTNARDFHHRIVRALDDARYPRGTWNIVVGHQPLVELKEGKPVAYPLGESFIQTLSSYPKTVYLCADVHNFQALRVDGLPIIVAGTGGASPDDLPSSHPQNVEVVATSTPFGFCEIRIWDDYMIVRYVQVIQPGGQSSQCDVVEVIIHEDGSMQKMRTSKSCTYPKTQKDTRGCKLSDDKNVLHVKKK